MTAGLTQQNPIFLPLLFEIMFQQECNEQQDSQQECNEQQEQEQQNERAARKRKRTWNDMSWKVVEEFAPMCALLARNCEKVLQESALHNGSLEQWRDQSDTCDVTDNVTSLQKVIEVTDMERHLQELQQSLLQIKALVEEWRQAEEKQ